MQKPQKQNVYVPANLTLRVLRLLVGISAFLFLFYVVGHYLTGWPFPTPFDLLRIASAVALGGLLGLVFPGSGLFLPNPASSAFSESSFCCYLPCCLAMPCRYFRVPIRP